MNNTFFSVLNLAAKCMGPAFRIHLRAHGTMPKIFSALKDAASDPVSFIIKLNYFIKLVNFYF